jgi:formate hydrogenlyase transcriptional activator
MRFSWNGSFGAQPEMKVLSRNSPDPGVTPSLESPGQESFVWRLMFASGLDSESDAQEIVGESAALKRVLSLVRKAAQTDSAALICGEPGSGKELVARAIHRVGPRRNGSFVKVSAATVGEGLLERELFGFERGLVDDAIVEQTIQLELANRGTLFLDEIDQFPPELQSKLLRVLERREFQRVGSIRSIPINVRVIAATETYLEGLVSINEFSRELYQQLNVFPIPIPPLRERREDIPLLVRHFVQRFARRLNKTIEIIPTKIIDSLQNRHWPGNVRELENFIERAVTLTAGSTLSIDGVAD